MLSFILFLALVAGAAFFGGQWNAKAWYGRLSKPGWTAGLAVPAGVDAALCVHCHRGLAGMEHRP
jgi:hypothetical protein